MYLIHQYNAAFKGSKYFVCIITVHYKSKVVPKDSILDKSIHFLKSSYLLVMFANFALIVHQKSLVLHGLDYIKLCIQTFSEVYYCGSQYYQFFQYWQLLFISQRVNKLPYFSHQYLTLYYCELLILVTRREENNSYQQGQLGG